MTFEELDRKRAGVLYRKAVEVWGERTQLLKTIEEGGELQKAIARYLIKKYTPEGEHPDGDQWEIGPLIVELMDEVVDVEIMIGQIKAAFAGHTTLYNLCRLEKIENLRRLLAVEEGTGTYINVEGEGPP